MPIFKATQFYGFRKSGASMSFYSLEGAFTDHASALNNFYTKITPLIAALMGTGVIMEGVRVSDITIKGDSRVKTDGGQVGTGKKYAPAVATSGPNDGNSCLVFNWRNGALHRGRTFMRFYPDECAEDSEYLPKGTYGTAAADLRRALETFLWGFRAKASNATFKITAVATNGTAPNSLKVTAPGHTVAAGSQFRIGKMLPKIGSPNQIWTAYAVSGSEITAEASGAFSAYTWGGKGEVTPLGQAVYPPLNLDILDRVRSRKSGRPFDAAVGRRKTAI